MNIKRGLATLAIAALSLTSLAACGSDTAQDEEKPDSLSFWYYEEDDAGQTQAWRRAAKAFEKETGVKINFERKSFTQIAQNGSQFLNSDEAPDLMESNRGNGSAGVLSTIGLLPSSATCQAVRLGQEGDRRKRSSRQVRRERHHGRRYLVRYDQLR